MTGKPNAAVPWGLANALGTLRVQRKQCATCIYREGLGWDLAALEEQVKDAHIGFKGYRVCHHSENAVCRGFWDRHKGAFPAGQIARRLGLVEFVSDDCRKGSSGSDFVP